MKISKKYKGLFALCAGASMLMASCASDEPFANGESGVLKVRMVVNSEVTRAEVNDASLADKCVVYISDSRGLIRKYQGLSNIPAEGITLQSGSYVAEAWTGDSVSASFDKKFYRGYQPFTIKPGTNNVVLECKIANVVASIKPETVDANLIKDWKLTIGNSRASLDFTAENMATDHGYFMMPDDETTLVWTLTGKDVNGNEFTKEGEIENVQRAHEYVLNLKYGKPEDFSTIGGGYITVSIDDTELMIEDDIILHAGPKIEGVGFDLSQKVAHPKGSFSDIILSSRVHGAITHHVLKFSEEARVAYGLSYTEYDLETMTEDLAARLNDAGVVWTTKTENDHTTRLMTFKEEFFNKITVDGEYPIEITLTAADGRSVTRTLQINISDSPVMLSEPEDGDINAHSAYVEIDVVKEDATNPGLQYREAGTSEWHTAVAATRTRATGKLRFHLTNLKPGTKYEFRAIADGYVGESMFLTTESIYVIPNCSFEDWGTNDGVPFPGLGTTPSFWDTGNKGGKMGSITLTDKTTEMLHSGTYGIKLHSQKAMGLVLAAGNLFTGEFKNTVGTSGAVLTFGRQGFNGSHPKALKLYVNYTPGTVDANKANSPLVKGDADHGQIFIALATKTFDLNTSNKDNSGVSAGTFFNPNDPAIVAYGEKTFEGVEYSENGGLKELVIPIEYSDRSVKPTVIVIVASSSKYGDFFSGGPNSIMYIDDMELIYD